MGDRCVIAVTSPIRKATVGPTVYPHRQIHHLSTHALRCSHAELQQLLITITRQDCVARAILAMRAHCATPGIVDESLHASCDGTLEDASGVLI